MRRSGLFAGWVAIALCAACTSTSAPPGGATPTTSEPGQVAPVTASLKVVADDPAFLDGPSATRLHLMTLRDLVFRVTLPQMPSSDATWVRLHVMNPMGTMVQERRFVFTTGAMHEVTVAAEQPHPMTAVPAHPIPGGWALDFSMPVGGTNMLRRPQPGLWGFIVDVEGRPDLHFEQVLDLWAVQ